MGGRTDGTQGILFYVLPMGWRGVKFFVIFFIEYFVCPLKVNFTTKYGKIFRIQKRKEQLKTFRIFNEPNKGFKDILEGKIDMI